MADAFLDGAPLVAITGQVSTDRMQLTSHQYLDLTAMFEPITKRSKQIIRPDTVGEIVRLAQSSGYCYATNKQLMGVCGLSDKSVSELRPPNAGEAEGPRPTAAACGWRCRSPRGGWAMSGRTRQWAA